MVTTGDIDNDIDKLIEEIMTFVYEEPKLLQTLVAQAQYTLPSTLEGQELTKEIKTGHVNTVS